MRYVMHSTYATLMAAITVHKRLSLDLTADFFLLISKYQSQSAKSQLRVTGNNPYLQEKQGRIAQLV
jgi:hypothetical protein